jgi:catechol 2,3-dioxygenase-like lactoylglutathione lyase family enzyme
MSRIPRFDHVGITVADLDTVTAFFAGLGLEVEGTRMFVQGEFLDTVIGIPDSRTEIVMLRPPDGSTRLELSSFVRPDHEPGSPAAMANELGLRNVAFEVDDLQTAIDRLAADGYGLVGGIGQYEVGGLPAEQLTRLHARDRVVDVDEVGEEGEACPGVLVRGLGLPGHRDLGRWPRRRVTAPIGPKST